MQTPAKLTFEEGSRYNLPYYQHADSDSLIVYVDEETGQVMVQDERGSTHEFECGPFPSLQAAADYISTQARGV